MPRLERQTTQDICKHESRESPPDDPHQPHNPASNNPNPDEKSQPLSLLGPATAEESLLPIRDRYLDWASLLKRVFAEDILDCPRCKDGKMEILAAISARVAVQLQPRCHCTAASTDSPQANSSYPLTMRKILVYLDLPADIPACAPARAPPQYEFDYGDYEDDDCSEY